MRVVEHATRAGVESVAIPAHRILNHQLGYLRVDSYRLSVTFSLYVEGAASQSSVTCSSCGVFFDCAHVWRR